MERGKVPGEVIAEMLATRARNLPTLFTLVQFRDLLLESGFDRMHVPFVSGFAGVVVGFGGREDARVRQGFPGEIGSYNCFSPGTPYLSFRPSMASPRSPPLA